MGSELIYTSAPHGLKAGSRGFCTVAFTEGMPPNYVPLCESLSGYRHLYAAQHDKYHKNPPSYSHYAFSIGGQHLSVLSRVASCALDYSGRTNKLAHHVIIDRSERQPCGPAALMSMSGFFEKAWDREPHVLKKSKAVPKPAVLPVFRAPTWEQVAGDAGWAGVLAEHAMKEDAPPAYIVYPPKLTDDTPDILLQLMTEALVWLPPQARWRVTFNTCFWVLPRGTECRWRCCLTDSEGLKVARRTRGALVLDLSKPLGACPDGRLVRCARDSVEPEWHTQPGQQDHTAPRKRRTASSAVAVAPDVMPGEAAVASAPPEERMPPKVVRIGADVAGRRRRLAFTVGLLLFLGCCSLMFVRLIGEQRARSAGTRVDVEVELQKARLEERRKRREEQKAQEKKKEKAEEGPGAEVQRRREAEPPAAQPNKEAEAEAQRQREAQKRAEDQVRKEAEAQAQQQRKTEQEKQAQQEAEAARREQAMRGLLLCVPGGADWEVERPEGLLSWDDFWEYALPRPPKREFGNSFRNFSFRFGKGDECKPGRQTEDRQKNPRETKFGLETCDVFDLTELCGQRVEVRVFKEILVLGPAARRQAGIDFVSVSTKNGEFPFALIWLSAPRLPPIKKLLRDAEAAYMPTREDRQTPYVWEADRDVFLTELARTFRGQLVGTRLVDLLETVTVRLIVQYVENSPYRLDAQARQDLPAKLDTSAATIKLSVDGSNVDGKVKEARDQVRDAIKKKIMALTEKGQGDYHAALSKALADVKELANPQRMANDIADRRKKLEAEADEFSKQIDAVDKQVGELREKRRDLALAKKRQLLRKKRALRREIDRRQQEVSLSRRRDEIKKEIKSLEAQENEVEVEVKKIQGKVDLPPGGGADDIGDINSQIKRLNTQINGIGGNLTRLGQERERLNTRLADENEQLDGVALAVLKEFHATPVGARIQAVRLYLGPRFRKQWLSTEE